MDWNEIRGDFPALKRYRYFYTASGGPLPRPVWERVSDCYRQYMEHGDLDWERNVERREGVRRLAAELIGADSDLVEFVPSAAAGMNIIAHQLTSAGDVLAATLEFPDTTLPWLHRRPGSVRWIEPDSEGAVPLAKIQASMDGSIGVLATSHVQFSNGFRQDLEGLGRLKDGRWLVVNATQSLGAFEVDVERMGIDALCCNSYKWLLAGYGCGIVYLSRPVIERREGPGVGWFGVRDRDSLANDRYSPLPGAARYNWGSPSFPAVFALGAALEYLSSIGIDRIQQRVLELSGALAEGLQRAGCRILSPLSPSSRSGELLVALDQPEATVQALRQRNIVCTQKPQGMRVAVHFFNNHEDIEALVQALQAIRAGT